MPLKGVQFKSPLLWLQRLSNKCNTTQCRYASGNTTYTSTPDTHTRSNRIASLEHTDSTQQEILHHAGLSATWWDLNGPLHGLHKLNDLRVPFVRDGLMTHSDIQKHLINTNNVLQGKNILEVGCGGGILTEALARLNANVTGVDLGEDVINTAQKHLDKFSPELIERITYKIEPIEAHARRNSNHYDAVVCSEVLEHIDDKAAFLRDCVKALKPGGSIFITTLNKTVPQWFGGIILGEYVFGVAPINTHHWHKLISPENVQLLLTALNCQTVLLKGFTYDVFNNRFRWIKPTAMCYALHAIKNE
ncbi:ubiquinone biosynthesis O-methyltransferase, mitochondrial [Ceratitis capitata]|uniref:Ubiquinone biosynthesis O-methyltransferase, mitochondrial n=1 Tax=Ceratitis capitata TaxID=7213 RepID=W8C5P0_CERCA|nr:ubiquinone biosynthesis O-methyltransferase, mitochondrial [Ceratitis capitata]CAD6999809.1 unnamed protein product [Ceratitis capitata]